MLYFPFVFIMSMTGQPVANPYMVTQVVTAPVVVAAVPAPLRSSKVYVNTALVKVSRHKIPEAKDLVTVQLKCPTEQANISTPSTWCLHKFFDIGFATANRLNLLPVELQQVCS